jgi:hypothetical protein
MPAMPSSGYVAAVDLAAENADLCNKLAELNLKAIVRMPPEFDGQAAHVIDPLHKAFIESLRSMGAGHCDPAGSSGSRRRPSGHAGRVRRRPPVTSAASSGTP